MSQQIWDPFIRLFHWSVVVCVLLTYWWLEGGEDWHEYLGYVVAALLFCRVIWGFCGSKNARFVSFFPTPKRLKRFVREPSMRHQLEAGHNPVGALMILFMMLLLVLVTFSGWLQETDRFWGEDWVQQLHKWSSDILMMAVAVHVTAVVFIQFRTGIPLIKAMIIGRR